MIPERTPRVDRPAAFRHVEELLAAERCVILDGGIATELQRLRPARGTSRGATRSSGAPGRSTARRRPFARCTARYVAAGCDVISTNTWSILSAPEAERRPIPRRQSSATGWTSRGSASGWRGKRSTSRGRAGRLRRRVRDLRGRQLARAAGHGRAARARLRAATRRTSILLETLTLVRDPETFETRRALARDGAAGLALLPPLPARRVRRVRAALGAARGRPLRARRASLRGDGRRRAPHQLPSRRPRPGNALVAPRLHGAPARRLPEPRSPRRPALALRRRDRPTASTRSWRSAGAPRARRSSAAAAARRRSTSRRLPRRSRTTKPGRERRRRRRPYGDERSDGRPGAAVARRAWTRRSSRCRSRSSSSTPASSFRRRAASSSGSTSSRPGSARARAASTSAADAGSWRSSSR